MDKAYYQEYYHYERTHWWFSVREKILQETISRFISPQKPLQILNIGAATGRSSLMLQQFGEVISIEYDKNCYEFTKKLVPIELIHGSILALPFEAKSFDMVCAFDVIEHVEDHKLAAEEMQRVCKSGGYLVTTVPAFNILWSQHDVVNHHVRRYKLSELIGLFSDKSKVLYRSYFNSILFPVILVLRIISRIVPRSHLMSDEPVGSDLSFFRQGGMLSHVFGYIFNLERYLLRIIRFPVGVSGMVVMRCE